MQEHIALHVRYLLLSCLPVVMLIYIVEPNMKLQLGAAFPGSSIEVKLTLITLDLLYVLFMASVPPLVIQTHVLFAEKLNALLEGLVQSLISWLVQSLLCKETSS